jgi:hypothetical protein
MVSCDSILTIDSTICKKGLGEVITGLYGLKIMFEEHPQSSHRLSLGARFPSWKLILRLGEIIREGDPTDTHRLN